PGEWSATPPSAGVLPRSVGTWAVVIDLPPDAEGRAVSIEGVRLAAAWHPDPASLADEGGGHPAWASPVGAAAWSSARYQRLLSPERRSPTLRWRWRLATMGLSAEPSEEGAWPGGTRGATIVEALARQMEARWQVALARLWEADAATAERVRRALTASADFGDGTIAPVWPEDGAALESLLADLLDPGLRGEALAARATRWLDALPGATAWVIDDAGREMAVTGEVVAAIGLANLRDAATLGWLTRAAGGGTGAPEPTPLPGLSTARLTIPLPGSGSAGSGAATGRGPAPASAIDANCGPWAARLPVASGALIALPPGLRCGPLLHDWTLAAWITGREDAGAMPAPEALTVAMLQRGAAGGGTTGTGEWTLYVECMAKGGDDGPDAVRVWLGPYGAPKAVLRISSDGALVDELSAWSGDGAGGGVAGSEGHVSVTRSRDRWTVAVPVPARCIEGGGRVRLAIERFTGEEGRRTAWPRRMLPWQAEPGRVVVDLSAW
ncbi:MAG TPA: hypothetical protein PLU35_13935, partial [Phycisphaerales bacterium]|nr:hypothetical protein [Phycisphaerales bacterium]